MVISIVGSNEIAIADLQGDQFLGKVKHLTEGLFTEYYIKRTINDSHFEGVLISKDRYVALLAGATSQVPSVNKLVKSDDFMIQNLMDVFDIINGRQQTGFNAQVADEGSKYVVNMSQGTVPSGAPYVVNVSAIAYAPILALEDITGSAFAVASAASSMVYFSAGAASKVLNISFADQVFAMYEVHQTLTEVTTVPSSYMLSYDHYQLLVSIQ